VNEGLLAKCSIYFLTYSSDFYDCFFCNLSVIEAKLYVGLIMNLELKVILIGTVLINKLFMTRIIIKKTLLIYYKSGIFYIL